MSPILVPIETNIAYDFLLVINTNLPILHRFHVYGWSLVKFSLARAGRLTLSLGVIPCQYRHQWYIAKN